MGGAEGGVSFGEWCGAVGEEFEVEAGAAGDDGDFAAGLDFRDDGLGEFGVAAGVAGFGGIEDGVEMVGCLGFFLVGGSGAEDGDALIELEGVGVDDLAVEFAGEADGECGFA